MSEFLEILLEVAFNILTGVLEILLEAWLPDFTCSDTTTNRIIWFIVLVCLGAVIIWELR